MTGINRICKRTKYIKVDARNPDPEVMAEAAAVLRRGGLVAFPTETVYGLGADALNGQAVREIFLAKGRPADNPLIVHLAGKEEIDALIGGNLPGDLLARADKLMKAFWPGPLTIILPCSPTVPREVTAGLRTVALRVPSHPVALALIKAAKTPVAAPSANISGRPSPTTAAHVKADLDGRIDVVLDGGTADVGVESTVLDLTGKMPVVLRPGGVSVEELEEVLGDVAVDAGAGADLDAAADTLDDPAAVNGGTVGYDSLEKRNGEPGESSKPKKGGRAREIGGNAGRHEIPRSPGMKYKHYAPKAAVILFEGDAEAVVRKIKEKAVQVSAEGRKVGILASRETAPLYRGPGTVISAGTRGDPATYAAGLYANLRRFDEMGIDVILAEGIETGGMGLAVMNRLRRAAGGRVIRVNHNSVNHDKKGGF